MNRQTLVFATAANLVISGCATAEFRPAAVERRVQAQASYPVMLERLFRRSCDVWLAGDSTICRSSVTTTSNNNRRKKNWSDETGGDPDDARQRKNHMSGKTSEPRQRPVD